MHFVTCPLLCRGMFIACTLRTARKNTEEPKIEDEVDFIAGDPLYSPISPRVLWARAVTRLAGKTDAPSFFGDLDSFTRLNS